MNLINKYFKSISVFDNEVYTFSEIEKQEDRKFFEEVMIKEILLIFNNGIQYAVSIKEMDTYYDSIKQKGIDFQQKRLNPIQSFKRKRNTNRSLSKYKARICCHEGK